MRTLTIRLTYYVLVLLSQRSLLFNKAFLGLFYLQMKTARVVNQQQEHLLEPAMKNSLKTTTSFLPLQPKRKVKRQRTGMFTETKPNLPAIFLVLTSSLAVLERNDKSVNMLLRLFIRHFLVWKKKVSVRRPGLQWRGPDDVRASGQKGPDFWRAQRRSDISSYWTLYSQYL